MSYIFGVARKLARDTGVQKWALFYSFFLATFMTLFSMFGLVHANNFLVVLAFCSLLYLCYFAGLILFSVRLFAEAFRVLGLKTRDYGFGAMTYLSGISQGLVAILLLKDRRLFYFFASIFILFMGASFVSYVLLANPLLSVIFLMLLFLVAIPYFVILLYHATRLCFSQLFYLSGRTFSDSIGESWEMVAGRTLSTFCTLAIAGAVLFCVLLPISVMGILFTGVLQGSAQSFSISISPVFSLFIDVFSFPFSFLMVLASIGFMLFYLGVFFFLLKDTGRLGGMLKKKEASTKGRKRQRT